MKGTHMTFTFSRPLVAGLALAAIVWSPALLLGRPQEGAPARQRSGGFPDLVSGLKATPGILGVERIRDLARRRPWPRCAAHP
jgi:hypothetical protein